MAGLVFVAVPVMHTKCARDWGQAVCASVLRLRAAAPPGSRRARGAPRNGRAQRGRAVRKRYGHRRGRGMSSTTQERDPEFEELLEFLRDERGFDFTGYKRPSLMRRITKRMQDARLDGDFVAYRDYLADH